MSYSIELQDPKTGEPVEVENHEEGSTYAIGGKNVADLDITYNYAWFYYHFLDKEKGLRWLYGKKAKDCIERLEAALVELGVDKHTHDDDAPKRNPDDPNLVRYKGVACGRQPGSYWCPTPGNAGAALLILLNWAKQYPDAVFDGD